MADRSYVRRALPDTGPDADWGLVDVTVRYGDRVALDDVTLAVPRGQVTAVVGGDGAGKSTLLRVLAGRIRPDAGQVHLPPRERIGFQPATSGTWANLSVVENLRLVAGAYHLHDAARIDALIAAAGLTAARDRLASRLSGGMRQKLGFIMAILPNPELLLLDEPSTGVDPVSRVELWALVSEAAARGTAVVMTTTYPDEAARAHQVLDLDAPASDAAPATAAPTPELSAPGAGEGDPEVAARHLTRRFGDHTAVADVSLTVAGGEVVGLIGANGAGKTTLIKMLLGLLPPTSGEAALFGEPPSRRTRARVGYVPQGLGLYGDLTVAENFRFATSAYGAAAELPDTLRPVARDLTAAVGLGRQRQLAFACALAHDPALLILDEPTSGVGVAERARLWETIHAQAAAGVGVLVSTHYMSEAAQCDRLVLMDLGRVVAAGTVAEIVGDTTAVRVRGDWARAFTALRAAGLPVALAGAECRVVDVAPDAVARVLSDAGIQADVEPVAATLEEKMTAIVLGRADRAA